MSLKNYTKEQLEDELKRREELVIPIQLESPDLTDLKRVTAEYIEELSKNPAGDMTNSEHFVFEEAMEAIYGKNIFDWINSVSF